jgi:plasmid replication initiation protein
MEKLKLIIYKDNKLIENFIFNATELELQILNFAVAVTNPIWENKNVIYKLEIPKLVSVYKTKSKSVYADYRKALDRLMKRTYSYYTDNRKKHTENLIIKVTEDLDDSSYLEFKFNEYVSTRISNLKGLFTKYNIEHISKFKSRYAFMLYEFFKMRLSQLKNTEDTAYKQKITVEDFKANLDLESKYSRFNDLERLVLITAQKNINTHSDINMFYKVIRKARTPTHIVFTAKYKKTKETKKVAPQEEPAQVNVLQNVAQKSYIEESKPMSDSQRASAKDQLAKLKANVKNKDFATA